MSEKKLTVRIPRDLDMRLGMEAIRQDTSKQALAIDALEFILGGGSVAADIAAQILKRCNDTGHPIVHDWFNALADDPLYTTSLGDFERQWYDRPDDVEAFWGSSREQVVAKAEQEGYTMHDLDRTHPRYWLLDAHSEASRQLDLLQQLAHALIDYRRGAGNNLISEIVAYVSHARCKS